ncbi:hypothetical protein ACFSVJ_17215 [Prauserella oleivorans]
MNISSWASSARRRSSSEAPSRSAAASTVPVSHVPSAAATSSTVRAESGSAAIRSANARRMRLCGAVPHGVRGFLPMRSVAVSSSRASGLPHDSARIRARVWRGRSLA